MRGCKRGKNGLISAGQGAVGNGCGELLGALINRFAQGFACFEMGNALFRDRHAFAGARVASHARRAPVDGETAESPDLDAMAPHQRLAHRVKDRLDGVLGVAMRELAETGGQFFDEIGAGHSEGLSSGA